MFFEVLFDFEGGHAAGAGGGDGLAIAAVLHIAAGKDAGNRHAAIGGQDVVCGADVAVFVEIHLAGKHLGVGLVADAEEEAADGQLATVRRFLHRAGARRDLLLFDAQHLFDDCVGAQLDVGVRYGTVEHDLGCAEVLAAVQQRNLAGEAGEEERLFHSRVAAADDGNIDDRGRRSRRRWRNWRRRGR